VEDVLEGPKQEAERSVRILWDFLCGFTNWTLAGVGLADTPGQREEKGSETI
jgi:hypothetical protein